MLRVFLTSMVLVSSLAVPAMATRSNTSESSIDRTLNSDASVDSDQTSAIAPLPLDVKTAGDISYVTGGVGDEELSMLKDRAASFNTHILMIGTDGEYVSGVHLVLSDKASTALVDEDRAGPYFYASLKPGSYAIEATSNSGDVKTLKFVVPNKGTVSREISFQ